MITKVLRGIGYHEASHWNSLTEAELLEDSRLAEMFQEMLCSVTREFWLSSLTWSSRYPGKFITLLSDKGKERARARDSIRADWLLLRQLQRSASQSALAAPLLMELQFPNQTFCAELFLMLAESEFEVTTEIRLMLEGFSRSWLGSVLNEDSFNKLRNVSSNQSAGIMGRKARWGTLAASDLLTFYSRYNAQVTPAALTHSDKAIDDSYLVQRDAAEFDLGAETLETMDDSNWAHPSAQNHKLVGALLQKLRDVGRDLEKLDKAWLALLVEPGTVLVQVGKFLVVGAAQRGLITVPCKYREVKEQIWLIATSSGANGWLTLTTLEDWRASRPLLHAPAQVAKQNGEVSGQICMAWLLDKGAGSSIPALAARRGFRQLTGPFLLKLMAYAQVKFERGKRPTKVQDMVTALVHHYYPKANADFINACLKGRDGPNKVEEAMARASALVAEEDGELLRHAVDSEDEAAVSNAVTHAKRHHSRRPEPSADASSSAPKPSKEWQRKPIRADKEFDVAQWKAAPCTLMRFASHDGASLIPRAHLRPLWPKLWCEDWSDHEPSPFPLLATGVGMAWSWNWPKLPLWVPCMIALASAKATVLLLVPCALARWLPRIASTAPCEIRELCKGMCQYRIHTHSRTFLKEGHGYPTFM